MIGQNCLGQTASPNTTQGGSNQMVTVNGGWGSVRLMKIPIKDTLQVFTNVSDSGRITIHPVDRNMYYHNGIKWVQLSPKIDSANYVTVTRLNDSITVLRGLITNIPVVDTTNFMSYGDTVNLIPTKPFVANNYVPLSRTVTINGDTQPLSADLVFTIPTAADSTVFATLYRLDTMRNRINANLALKLDITTAASTYATIASVSGKEDASNKSADTNLSLSNTLYPTKSAVRKYVERFTSTYVRNPYAWWDFTDTLWMTRNGSLITSVLDKSGNGFTATQANTSQQATFVANGGSNGQARADFTGGGSGTRYTTSTQTYDTASSGFFVAKITQLSGIAIFLGSTSPNFIGYDWSNPGFVYSVTGPQQDFGYYNPKGWFIFSFIRNGRNTRFYVNGMLLTKHQNNVTTNVSTLSGIANVTGFGLGAQVSEIIMYNRTLTQQEFENTSRYLSNKYGILHNTVATGDSYPDGFGQTTGLRFPSLLASTYDGYGEMNMAVSGSMLINADTPVANNLYSRIAYIPEATTPDDRYIIMIGLNDSRRTNNASYSPRLFQWQYNTVVNEVIRKGYKPKNIMLCTQPVINNAASGFPFNQYSLARYDSIATAIRNVQAGLGTRLCDLRNYFGSYGVTYNADPIHMNTAQHDSTAKLIRFMYSLPYTPTYSVSTSASGYYPIMNTSNVFTGTNSTWQLPPVTGNNAFYIDVVNMGSGVITVNSNAGGNDIYFNGNTNTTLLPAGSYRFENRNSKWVLIPTIDMSAVVTTTDATPTTIATIPLATSGTTGALTFEVTGNTAGGGRIYNLKRVGIANKAGTLNLVGGSVTAPTPTQRDSPLTTADFTVAISGTNALIQVTGEAATTINWKVTYKYHID